MTDWKEQEGNAGKMWLPDKEGEELIGVVEEIITDGKYGNQYRILPDGEKESIVTPSHKFLVSRMEKVQKGDNVKIIYNRTDVPKVKGENGMRIYQVFIG